MNQMSDLGSFSMLDIFRMEVQSQVTQLNDNLLAIESCPEISHNGTAQKLECLMRAAHSIKGAARIVGLDLAVNVAHVMEDCFVAAQQSKIILTSDYIDILLDGIDWFETLAKVSEPELPDWLKQQELDTSELVKDISSLLKTSLATQTQQKIDPSPSNGSVSSSDSSSKEIIPPDSIASTPNLPSDLKVEKLETIPPEQTHSIPPSDNTENESASTASLADQSIEHSSNPPVPLPPQPGPQPAIALNDVENLAQQQQTLHNHKIIADSTRSSALPTERVVRVSVDNLNRLMALAGESLVEVNWFQPFSDTMLHLKQQQKKISRSLEKLEAELNLSTTSQYHLAEAQKTAQDCHSLLSDRLEDLDQFSQRFAQLSDNLYREVIASHMCPFSEGTQGLPRLVRDLAKQLGKQVNLEVIGQNTPVDRDILDKLEAPLVHMLNNAVFHGIELPEVRQQKGKSETGTIRIEATHRAGMLCINVSDDGCGITLESLRTQVVQKQLTTADMAANLSEAELMEFLFLPGFSTAKGISEIAGRGVGLDIAKSMVQDVGGLLRAFSPPGKGLEFHFQLPLTLSVIKALVVEISEEPYALGLNRIDQVLMVQSQAVSISENKSYIVVNNENISLVSAQQVLELPESNIESRESLPVVILSDQIHRYGVVVDQFLGERDLVVRPLDPRLGKVQDISAAALTEEGTPLLVIDVADLVCSINQMVSGGQLQLKSQPSEQSKQHKILVVDDSITVREMERKLLQNHGYQVDVAVNGMEGWNTIRTGQYDLVISDIDMPRMNGIELVQQIKDHPRFKQLPVIIVSYKDRQEDHLAGLKAGADYYLTKSSFHDNSLIQAVIDLIGD